MGCGGFCAASLRRPAVTLTAARRTAFTRAERCVGVGSEHLGEKLLSLLPKAKESSECVLNLLVRVRGWTAFHTLLESRYRTLMARDVVTNRLQLIVGQPNQLFDYRLLL